MQTIIHREKKRKEKNNRAAAPLSEAETDEEDDDGMDPMEAMRIWKEAQKKKE